MIKINMTFPSAIKPDDRMSLWLGLSFFLWFVIYVSTIAFGDSWSETGLMRNKLGKSFPSRISHWYGLNTDTKLNQIKNKVSILKYWKAILATKSQWMKIQLRVAQEPSSRSEKGKVDGLVEPGLMELMGLKCSKFGLRSQLETFNL